MEFLTLAPWPQQLDYLAERGWKLAAVTVTDRDNNQYNLTIERMQTQAFAAWFADNPTAMQRLLQNYFGEGDAIPQPREPEHAVPMATFAEAAPHFKAGENLRLLPLMVKGTDTLIPFRARNAFSAGFHTVAFEITHDREKPLKVALVLKESADAAAWFVPERDYARAKALLQDYEPPKPPQPATRSKRLAIAQEVLDN